MYNHNLRISETQPKLFQELKSEHREKIAAIIEDNCDYMIISKAVDDYIYGTTRALDAGDYFNTFKKSGLWEHAVNKNADYFDITELEDFHPEKQIQRYLTFRTAGMYKNHESDRIENSIGLVFDSVLLKEAYDDMHVVTLFGIDKKKAPPIARDLETHPTRIGVSMGCSITHSICTACGKYVHTEADFCDCLRYARGQRRNNKKVAELLRGVDFFELSVVSSPAAIKAYVIDTITKLIPGRLLKVAQEKDMQDTVVLLSTIHSMIKNSNTVQEKQRLVQSFDKIISEIESYL